MRGQRHGQIFVDVSFSTARAEDLHVGEADDYELVDGVSGAVDKQKWIISVSFIAEVTATRLTSASDIDRYFIAFSQCY